MQLNIAKLVLDMDQLSRETWRRIEIGDATGLKFREDSITDHVLFSLMEKHPQLAVRRFTQHAEKRIGADWEWWIGSDELGWFSLRIQAKRVHDTCYTALDHPGAVEGDYQYQTLIAGCEAGRKATYPFHVFFNGWHESRFKSDRFESCQATCAPLDQALWGCAAMSSYTVNKLHLHDSRSNWSKRSHVPRYMPSSLPWSQLFTPHCSNWRKTIPADWLAVLFAGSPEQTFRAMHGQVLLADLRGRGFDVADLLQVVDNRLDDPQLLHRELPGYAATARDAHAYFIRAGADYIENNHNFQPTPDDDPEDTRPRVVSILDLNFQSDELQ